MLRFGIITAYAAEDATSAGLLAACSRLGEAVAIDPADLAATVDVDRPVVLAGGRSADSFDVFLLVRGIGRAGDPDIQFEIYRALELGSAPVINRLEAMLAAQDKFRTSLLLARAGISTPAVCVAQEPAAARAGLARFGRAVSKPIHGSLGEGIELICDDRAGRRRLEELIERCGSVYLQRYVEHGGRDVRAFVVGGRVVAAIERIAPAGEFRTNVSVGGEAVPIALDDEGAELAIRAALTLGLDWAGVDLAYGPTGPTVIEVNGSPNWEGIRRATGEDMAEAIARHAAARARARLRLVEAPAEGTGG